VSNLKIRELVRDDLNALSGFWDRNGRPGAVSAESWNRRWSHNALMADGAAPLAVGWAIEAEPGKVVGHLGNVALPYELRGRRIAAAAAADWHVEQQYRSSSIQLLARFFGQESVGLFVNSFPTETAIRAWTAFGGRNAPVPDCGSPLFRVVDYEGFVQATFRRKGLPLAALFGPIAGTILRLVDGAKGICSGARRGESALRTAHATTLDGSTGDVVSAVLSRCCNCPRVKDDGLPMRRNGSFRLPQGWRVRIVREFGGEFDKFWQALRSRSQKLLLVRDGKRLSWYFRDFLAGDRGWICVLENDAGMIGYAIYVLKNNREIGLKRAWIADLQVLDDDMAALQSLIWGGVEECGRREIHVCEAIGFCPTKRNAARKLLPRMRAFANWPFIYRTADPNLREELKNPDLWDPCIMDGADAL